MVKEFLEEYFQSLKEFQIDFTKIEPDGFGKIIVENINLYSDLKNTFVKFFEFILKKEWKFNLDILIEFLESICCLTEPLDKNRGSWNQYEFDNFRFIIQELFLYIISLGLKHSNYKLVADLLYNHFFPKIRGNNHQPERYDFFYKPINIFHDYYCSVYSQKYFSAQAEFMFRRLDDTITIKFFVLADLICNYIAMIDKLHWFPLTYVYYMENDFEIFYKLISRKHFEKVKCIFRVNTIEELKNLLIELMDNRKDLYSYGYSSARNNVMPIFKQINIDDIGKLE